MLVSEKLTEGNGLGAVAVDEVIHVVDGLLVFAVPALVGRLVHQLDNLQRHVRKLGRDQVAQVDAAIHDAPHVLIGMGGQLDFLHDGLHGALVDGLHFCFPFHFL